MGFKRTSNPFWQSSGGAALISGIGGAASGLFGGLFAGQAQRRQFNYNARLQDDQQNWQKYMWDLENMYNHPAREVDRLLRAGINPALAFSNSGGAAAPVPMSGSSGGVSAPTASMPNLGAAAIDASMAQQHLENETKVADSVAEKNKAEAESVGVQTDYVEFNLGVDRQLRSVIVGNRQLAYDFGRLQYALGQQDYVRGELYTAAFPTLLSQRMESNRINIKLLGSTVNKIDAEVALLASQKQLTDDQVKIARQKLVCATFDAMMARYSQDVFRNVFDTKYDPATGEYAPVMDKLKTILSNRISEMLSRSETGLLEAGFDSSFQSEYGERLRFYNYETVRRGANHIRSRIYTDIVNSVVGVGSSVIGGVSAGSSVKLRRELMRQWNKTGSRFGANVPYSGSMPDATTPSYHGGSEYYPLYDF